MKYSILFFASLFFISISIQAQTTRYVNLNASGANNGTSPTDAFKNLDDAIAAANSRDIIKVTQGTYYPTKPLSGTSVSDQSFYITKSITLEGGYNAAFSSRDVVNNKTILDGNVGSIDDESDNSCHVIVWKTTDGQNGKIDGFIIRNGTNNGRTGTAAVNRTIGAGVHHASGILTISNSNITNNKSSATGGGIYSTANPLTLENVEVSGNGSGWNGTAYTVANGHGGGIYANNTIELKGSITINNNYANGSGGGIYKNSTAGTEFSVNDLQTLIVDGNTANVGSGGGIYTFVSLDLSNLQSGSISDNKAKSTGGGIYAHTNAVLTLNNTIVSGNKAGWDDAAGSYVTASVNGGGIYGSTTLTLQGHMQVNGNTTTALGGGVFANNTLELKGKIELKNNTGTSGGGLYKNATNTIIASSLDTLIVVGNKSTNTSGTGGGGIYTAVALNCSNLKYSLIEGNEAQVIGGGIHATNLLYLYGNMVVKNNISGSYGGGIYAANVLSLSGNLTLEGNRAAFQGGGVWKHGTGGFIVTNIDTLIIKNNKALGGEGGGIYTPSQIIEFFNLKEGLLEGNTSTGRGGAIYAGGGLVLRNTEAKQNSSNLEGGAIFVNKNLEIDLSYYHGNSAGGLGGAIYKDAAGTMAITRSTFAQNNAPKGGAITSAISSAFTQNIANCTFSGNTSGSNGGAVYFSGTGGSGSTITYSSFNNNSTGTNVGNAIYFNYTGSVKGTLNGNIIYGNGTGNDPKSEIYYTNLSSNIKAYFNIIRDLEIPEDVGQYNKNLQAGQANQIFANVSGDVATLANNGDLTPFIMPTLLIKEGGLAHDQISLGDASSFYNSATDQRGINRVVSLTDIGSIELSTELSCNSSRPDSPITWYVDQSTTSEGDGMDDLSHPAKTLTAVLNNPCLREDDVIKIAQGIYYSTESDRNNSFMITKAISIYGGYTAGFANRDTKNNPTILDGNKLSYHVILWNTNVTKSGLIDGVTIRNGKSDGNGSLASGAGIFLSAGQLILSDYVVENNWAANKGGGIYSGYGTTLTLKNGTSRNNKAGYINGEYNNSIDNVPSGDVQEVSLLEQKSGGFVSALANLNLEGHLVMQRDTAAWSGGGILKSVGGDLNANNLQTWLMEDCSAMSAKVPGDQKTGNFGGGGLCSMVDTYLDNTVITANRCKAVNNQGGAVFINNKTDRTVVLKVANSNFTDCYAGMDGGALESYSSTTSVIDVTNSNFYNCDAGRYGGALGVGNALALTGKIVMDQCDAGVNGGGISQWDLKPNVASIPFNATQLDTLIITNCNVLTPDPAFTNASLGGGAIWSNKSDVDLSNAKYVLLENNYCRDHGGAIRIYSSTKTLTLGNNVIFRNNRAGYVNGNYTGSFSGGAIYMPNGNIIIKGNAVFENNSASSHGGAIYAPGALTLSYASFKDNQSISGNGGAIWKNVSGKMTISKSTFENNTAKLGGAIHTSVATNGNLNSISNSTFSENSATAGSGGAIYSSAGGAELCVKIQSSSFNGNTASNNIGHAIYYANASGELLNGNIICGNGSTGSEINTTTGLVGSYNISKTALLGASNKQTNAVDSIFESTNGDIAVLADNGGFTKTLMIKTGGLAQNKIPIATFNTWGVDDTDQRDSVQIADCAVDVGSVEKKSQVSDAASYAFKPIRSVCSIMLVDADTLIASTINIKDTLYYNDKNYTELLSMPVQGKNKIYVKFISIINCEVLDSISLNLIPNPTAKINKTTTQFCSGNPLKLVVDTTHVSSIQWSSDYADFANATNINSDTLKYTPLPLVKDTTIKVYVTALGIAPCSTVSDTITITLKGRPTVKITNVTSTSGCAGEEVKFTLVTTNSTYLEWTGGEGTLTPTRQSSQLNYAYDSIPHTYIPVASERGKVVELALKSAGGTCGYLYDTVRVTVLPLTTSMNLELLAQPKAAQTTCQDTSYIMKVKATDVGDLKNIKIKLFDDKQTNIMPIAGEYKYSTGNWIALDTLNRYTWLIPQELNGNDSLYVRTTVRPGCEFTSGDDFKFELQATNSCNEALQSKQVTTDKFYLRSDPTLSSTYTFQNITTPIMVNSQNGDTIYHRIRLNISGTQPTDKTRESIVSFIPTGFSIVPGSLNYIHNADEPATYTPVTGGIEVRKPIPTGITNDSVIYEVKLYAGAASCGDYNVRTQVYYDYQATCGENVCSASSIRAEYSETVKVRRYAFTLDPSVGTSIGGETKLGKWSGNINLQAINGLYASDSLKVDFYVDMDGSNLVSAPDGLPVKTVYVRVPQDVAPGESFVFSFKDIPATAGRQLIAFSNDKLLCSPFLMPITIILGPDTICQNKIYEFVSPEGMENYSFDAISGATRVPVTSVQDYPTQNIARIKFTSGSGDKEVKGSYARTIGGQTSQAAKTTFHTYLNPAITYNGIKTENDQIAFCTPGVAKIYVDNIQNITSQQWTAPTNIGTVSGSTTDTLTYTLNTRIEADTTVWVYYTATSLSECNNLKDSIQITIYQTLTQPDPAFLNATICEGSNKSIECGRAQGGGIPDNSSPAKVKGQQMLRASSEGEIIPEPDAMFGMMGVIDYTYQWQDSTATRGWQNAPDAFENYLSTDQEYLTSALSETTWFRRIVNGMCDADTGNIVKITVLPKLEILDESLTVTNSPCPTDEVTVSFEMKGGTAPYSYKLNDGTYQNITPDSITVANNMAFHITGSFPIGTNDLYIKDATVCNDFHTSFNVESNTLLLLTPSVILYVKENPSGDGTGTSWDNAFNGKQLGWYLQNRASENQVIYIAEGTYYPYYQSCDNVSMARDYAFVLNKNNINIIGGFDSASTGTDLSSYNPKQNITRLSGAIQTPSNTDNSYHVILIENSIAADIKGLVISDGYAHDDVDYSGDKQNGGGILDKGTGERVDISQVVLENNFGDYGAAVYFYGNTKTVLDSVTVRNNQSLINFGGSVFAWGDFAILNSTVNDNNDGIVSWGGDLAVVNSTITNNTRYGIFAQNTTDTGDNIRLNITGSTITKNSNAGVRLNCKAGKVINLNFTNNLILNNNVNTDFTGASSVTVASFKYSIVGNIKYKTSYTDTETFTKTIRLGDLADNGGWGQTIALTEACYNPAVRAGDPALLSSELTQYDQRGVPRNNAPTIGAYDFVALPPSQTTWTGAAGSVDWNNPSNWSNGVPASCTNVIIPEFSDLTPYPAIEETDAATCATISFKANGEVSKTAYLTYNSAKVDLSVPINVYHVVAPPLGSMYSGDYFIDATFDPAQNGGLPRQNPAVWAKVYQTTNPQTQVAVEAATWSRYFNTLDYPLPPGSGFSIWVDNGILDPSSDFTMHFPKDSTQYYYYNDRTGAKGGQTGVMDRTFKKRFVYEQVSNYNKTTGDFDISVTSDVDGSNVFGTAIVGNPFMSHLNFTKFYQANSNKIEPAYHLWSGESFETIMFGDTDNPLSTEENNSIAPMQAFVVTKKVPSVALETLKFTADMSKTLPGSQLKASHQEPSLLKLSMNRDGYRHSGILLQYKEGESNQFRKDKDVWTMFANNMSSSAILYALIDGKAASIRTIGDISERIPLGISTTEKGVLTFSFENAQTFVPDAYVYLEDAVTKQLIDLRQEYNEYSFTNTTGNVQDRFFIKISQMPLSLDKENLNPEIFIYAKNQRIYIQSSDNDRIENVEFYDLQGKLIFVEKDIRNQHYSKEISKDHQVLIVKVKTLKTVQTKKIVQ